MNIVAQLTTERQLVCQTSNGLHWTEMALLCPGVQYGLSSQQNFGENKDLIFVKLTDSALRAIEEYIKNQNKFSHNPTIKFLGNENGELSFPSLHHEGDGGATHFSFTMSSTADMEGQGGSFECIKQSPRGTLEGLGSIPRKIRVHANDDVYEATRHRMTEAEDKYKNKCTREIKPNQTDIGRKVKVKQSGRPMIPVRKEAAPSMRDVLLKTSSSSPYGGGQQAQPVKPLAPPAPAVHSSTNTNGGSQHQLLSNGLGSNHVSSSRPQPSKKPSVPDIAKRPLKERLIHLLAMKPFRKFELHDRLLKEGLREKNGITTTLRQVAAMKDNCFHLNRAMWNEVHEDWPFYTDSERQMLKRRKPQNLTPPGGSDGGSSGSSGQSPTSTHPGSPPPLPAVSSSSNKRPGFRDGPDGFPYKRQRIAHTNRPPPLSSTLHQPQMAQVVPAALVSVQPIENNSQRRPVTDSRDASNMNPRSRESPTSGYFGSMNGCYVNGMLNDKRNLSDDEDLTVAAKKRSCDSHSVAFVGSARTFLNGRSSSPVANRPTAVEEATRKEELSERYISTPNSRIRPDDRDRTVKYSKERIARVSPDSQTDAIPVTAVDLEPGKVEEEDEDDGEFPDYKKDYVTIQDRDQRRQYKSDFNAHYAEYRDLHGVVEKVSKRFLQLEERLKQEDENSAKYKDIKKQIVREYQEKKKDPEHQKAKRRFQYLHDKLSFIKRLVMEYDQGVTDCRY